MAESQHPWVGPSANGECLNTLMQLGLAEGPRTQALGRARVHSNWLCSQNPTWLAKDMVVRTPLVTAYPYERCVPTR